MRGPKGVDAGLGGLKPEIVGIQGSSQKWIVLTLPTLRQVPLRRSGLQSTIAFHIQDPEVVVEYSKKVLPLRYSELTTSVQRFCLPKISAIPILLDRLYLSPWSF